MKTKLQLYGLVLCIGLLGFVNGVKAASTFTLTSGADPTLTASWKKVPGGTPPANFTTASQTFEIAVTAGVMSQNWTVSGNSSKVIIESGGTLADNATHSLSLAALTISSGGILVLSNNTFSPGTYIIQLGSTVNYAGVGTQTILSGTYYNLIVSGTGTINNGGDIVISTSLTINAGCALNLNGAELDLNAAVSGAGTITGDNNSATIIINGSVGTLNFTSGGAMLNDFEIDGGSVTLGTSLLISGAGSGSTFSQSGGSINLNGHTLTLDTDCGTLFGGSSSNVITGSSTSSLIVNCNSSVAGSISNSLFMDVTSPGTSNALSNLTLNGDQTLTLASALSIIDSICPTAGTINASSGSVNLVFTSSTKTGRVGQMGSTGALTGSTITSNIERPGGNTQWCLMGLPGIVPSTSTFDVYDGQFPMTCASCPNGSDDGFTSVDSWSETGQAFTAITASSNSMSNGQGYWFYMGQTINTTVAMPISVTGAVASAVSGIAFPLTVTGSSATTTGYNLLANPVPSPISWAAFRAGNASVNTSYFVYSPNDGSGAYITYDIITGSSPAGLSDAIAQGQGFYVLASSATSLNLTEGDKINGGSQALERVNHQTTQSSSGVNYFRIQVSGSGQPIDEAVFEFNANAVTGRDIYDAPKLPTGNPSFLQASSSSYGVDLTINANPALTTNYSIPVKMITTTTGSYLVNPADMANMPSGGCIILHDNYTGTNYDLRAGSFNLTLNDTETVARFVLNITVLPLTITTNTKQASCSNTHDGLITAVGNDAGPWNYTWKNASGTVVKTTLNKPVADSLTGLNNGVYNVQISTVGTCNSATQTFTLTAPSAPTSLFTAPTSVNVSANVSFTNNSTNATNYIWYFGDGGISSQQTATYAYNMPGTYTVTLDAIIASCNDTVSSTQVILVEATTGIKQVSGSGNITLSRDGSGNYLQFDYGNPTKVNITVYNILGQNLLNNAGVTVVNDRFYLNVNGSENQVLYVTITNLNNNQQTTKKFVND
jgi:PKD repeat protein